jgi:hypothetical protein
MRIDLSDLDRLEGFVDALARLFYCLMVIAFFAAIGSPGTGLFFLILGAAAFVVRAGLEDFIASRGDSTTPPEPKAEDEPSITVYRARAGRSTRTRSKPAV